jgi:hypothetical protein
MDYNEKTAHICAPYRWSNHNKDKQAGSNGQQLIAPAASNEMRRRIWKKKLKIQS